MSIHYYSTSVSDQAIVAQRTYDLLCAITNSYLPCLHTFTTGTTTYHYVDSTILFSYEKTHNVCVSNVGSYFDLV